MTRLFINYYNNPERLDEHLYCLQENISNAFLNQIVCLCNDVPPVENDKLVLIKGYDRPTFTDFFNEINKLAESDDVSIISNLDIYFNDTAERFQRIKENEAWCLTRWNKTSTGIRLFETPDSQDTWAFRGKVKPVENTDILQLGLMGIDNRLAWQLNEAGYNLVNCARTVQTIHVHKNEWRPERTEHNVVPPPYLTLWPQFL